MMFPELCLLASSILLGVALLNFVLVEFCDAPDVLDCGLPCVLHYMRILLLIKLSGSQSTNNPVIYALNYSDLDTNQEMSVWHDGLLLSPNIHKQFRKDGVIALRNVLPPNILSDLIKASDSLVGTNHTSSRRGRGKQFHTVKTGAIFIEGTSGDAFRNVALYGLIPRIGAELLGLQPPYHDHKNMRLLRDVFLAKDDGQYVCGWHVDDYGFWPAHPLSEGVNAWIAIDDMPIELGGNFAVSPGSHNALWRNDAYQAVGATPTFPEEGYQSAEDMFTNRVGAGTCNLNDAEPLINDYLERNSRTYNVKAGDVLFMTRWLWHRTISMKENERNLPNSQIFNRYSIRYALGDAKLPRGYGTELSILWDNENEGKALNDVSGGPWYPQVFPSVNLDEINEISDMINKRIPEAELLLKERQKEMKPYLNAISRQRVKHYKEL